MVFTRQIAVLLLGACLGGCGYVAFDQDAMSPAKQSWLRSADQNTADQDVSTAQTTGSTDKFDSPTKTSLFARANGQQKPAPTAAQAAAAPPALPPQPKPVAFASADPLINPAAPSADVPATPRGRAYLFRGIAGLIYSRGMDGLAERIRRVGIPSSVDTYLVWRSVVEQVIADYRRDPQPITIIGHSMGGDSALSIAETLNSQNIPVALLITYDPSRIADDVPPNVERYINIYQSSNFMGGGNVVQGTRFHGHYASYNLKNHRELVHINIEKADRIQEQIVAKIVQLSITPAAAKGDAVPVRFEVPAQASVELWDSGLPVAAHAGDTLKSLAASYHVPVWSLTQVNSDISETTELSDGQRVIVPRHLVPMAAPATMSSYAPTLH